MRASRRNAPPQAAFIPIGIALIVVGMNGNRGLIGAGILFLIAGIASVARHRKSRDSDEEPTE